MARTLLGGRHKREYRGSPRVRGGRIPTLDSPQVDERALKPGSLSASPVRELPGLSTANTQALQELANTAREVYLKEQKEADKIAVLDHENNMDLMFQESEMRFIQLKGKQVIGQSEVFENDVLKKLEAVAKDLTPSQKELLTPKFYQRLSMYRNTIGKHTIKENQDYKNQVHKTAIDRNVDTYLKGFNNPETSNQAIKDLKENITAYGESQGWNKKIINGQYKKAKSGADLQIIKSLVDRGQVEEGRAWYSANITDMTGTDSLAAKKVLEQGNDLAAAQSLIDELEMKAGGDPLKMLRESDKIMKGIKDSKVRDTFRRLSKARREKLEKEIGLSETQNYNAASDYAQNFWNQHGRPPTMDEIPLSRLEKLSPKQRKRLSGELDIKPSEIDTDEGLKFISQITTRSKELGTNAPFRGISNEKWKWLRKKVRPGTLSTFRLSEHKFAASPKDDKKSTPVELKTKFYETLRDPDILSKYTTEEAIERDFADLSQKDKDTLRDTAAKQAIGLVVADDPGAVTELKEKYNSDEAAANLTFPQIWKFKKQLTPETMDNLIWKRRYKYHNLKRTSEFESDHSTVTKLIEELTKTPSKFHGMTSEQFEEKYKDKLSLRDKVKYFSIIASEEKAFKLKPMTEAEIIRTTTDYLEAEGLYKDTDGFISPDAESRRNAAIEEVKTALAANPDLSILDQRALAMRLIKKSTRSVAFDRVAPDFKLFSPSTWVGKDKVQNYGYARLQRDFNTFLSTTKKNRKLDADLLKKGRIRIRGMSNQRRDELNNILVNNGISQYLETKNRLPEKNRLMERIAYFQEFSEHLRYTVGINSEVEINNLLAPYLKEIKEAKNAD